MILSSKLPIPIVSNDFSPLQFLCAVISMIVIIFMVIAISNSLFVPHGCLASSRYSYIISGGCLFMNSHVLVHSFLLNCSFAEIVSRFYYRFCSIYFIVCVINPCIYFYIVLLVWSINPAHLSLLFFVFKQNIELG